MTGRAVLPRLALRFRSAWFGWTSSSSKCRDVDTDAPGKATSRVADLWLVVTGEILDINISGNLKRSYCLIANDTFLFHTVV
jgi:hypothetical protein